MYKKNFILCMIILLKVLGLDQNAIGMNIAKSPQSFFLILKRNVVVKIKFIIFYEKQADEDVEILNKIKRLYETLFKSLPFKYIYGIEAKTNVN